MISLARKVVTSAVFVGMIAFFSGCAATKETENASSRPWNASPGYSGLPSSLTEGR